MAAVVVACRHFNREVDQPELFVHANLPPDAGVARVGPGIVLPGFVSVLVGKRNGMENPEALAGPCVECADVAFSFLRLLGTLPGKCAAPTMIVFPATTGAACRPISPVMRSIFWSSSSLRSTMPSLPKPGTGRPILASSAIIW